jgi:hypothetical protein
MLGPLRAWLFPSQIDTPSYTSFIAQGLCQIESCRKTKGVLARDRNKNVNSCDPWLKPVTSKEAMCLSFLCFALAHKLPYKVHSKGQEMADVLNNFGHGIPMPVAAN